MLVAEEMGGWVSILVASILAVLTLWMYLGHSFAVLCVLLEEVVGREMMLTGGSIRPPPATEKRRPILHKEA